MQWEKRQFSYFFSVIIWLSDLYKHSPKNNLVTTLGYSELKSCRLYDRPM